METPVRHYKCKSQCHLTSKVDLGPPLRIQVEEVVDRRDSLCMREKVDLIICCGKKYIE